MPKQVKRRVLARGFSVWTKNGSPKVWIEAGKKWANYIIKADGWSLAEILIKMGPFGIAGTLFIAVIRWHSKKLKKHVGRNGIWIGLDPTKFVRKPYKSMEWWKHVDARPRNKSNMQKEPVPW